MDLKPGYVQTEIGVFPEDWNISTIGDVAIKVGSGITPTGGNSRYKKYGRPFVRSQNVDWGEFILDDLVFIDEDTHNEFPATELHKNDVLLNITGASIGRSALVDDILTGGNVNQHVCIIRLNQMRVHPRFLNLLLLSAIGQRQIDSFQAGGNREGLNFAQIKTIKFPLPPTLIEQEQIAKMLNDVDTFIKSLRKLIAKKRGIRQTVIQELLTGRKHLPGFTGNWELVNLGDIADPNKQWSFAGGPFGSNLKFSDYTPDGIRIIQLQNIGDGEFKDDNKVFTSIEKADELSSNNIYPGDIILSKMGDPVARACIVPPQSDRYLMSSDGIRLAVDHRRFNTYFVFTSINSPPFRRKAENASTGSTRKRIGLTELRNLELLCPELKEQTAIATILSDLDAEITTLHDRMMKIMQLKQGMMQELLTGRIRLA